MEVGIAHILLQRLVVVQIGIGLGTAWAHRLEVPVELICTGCDEQGGKRKEEREYS
jgi:hypothetical protein